MKIKRYEVEEDPAGMFRVLDKKKDDWVVIHLMTNTREQIEEIMGKDMSELVDSSLVHESYLANKEDSTHE